MFAVLMIGGCSGPPPLVPTSGTVLHDGKPAANVTVTFYPEGNTEEGELAWVGRGQTDAHGRVTIRYQERAEGVPVGTYRVTLSTERPDIEGAETFPPEYSNPEKTVLTVTVSEGGSNFQLEASSKIAPKQPRVPDTSGGA